MLLFRCIEKQRYIPAGMKTVPPPLAEAASIARLIEFVSSVLPSPLAPNVITLKKLSAAGVNGPAGPADERPGQNSNDAKTIHIRPEFFIRDDSRLSCRHSRGCNIFTVRYFYVFARFGS